MVKELTIFEHASGPGRTAGDHDAVPMAAPVAGGAASDGMPRAAGLADEETIMMVGNPGMGKSTLLNQLCAAVRFKSGEGTGDHGCTTQLQWHEEPPANGWPKINLCDTPGLADLSMAEVAAAQIKAALERKPNARLLFVMKENDNRVAPCDVATVQAVLDAIDLDPQDKQNRYGMHEILRTMEGLSTSFAYPVDCGWKHSSLDVVTGEEIELRIQRFPNASGTCAKGGRGASESRKNNSLYYFFTRSRVIQNRLILDGVRFERGNFPRSKRIRFERTKSPRCM